METFDHDLPKLFDQLGLDSSPEAIHKFAETNKLHANQKISEAGFWNVGQRRFLEKELEQDSEWCMAIDQLAELMTSETSAGGLLHMIKKWFS